VGGSCCLPAAAKRSLPEPRRELRGLLLHHGDTPHTHQMGLMSAKVQGQRVLRPLEAHTAAAMQPKQHDAAGLATPPADCKLLEKAGLCNLASGNPSTSNAHSTGLYHVIHIRRKLMDLPRHLGPLSCSQQGRSAASASRR
jgi:hypothetical protein